MIPPSRPSGTIRVVAVLAVLVASFVWMSPDASAQVPQIQVEKTASPETLPEPGGNFTFTVVVTNTGNEQLIITSLTDNIYGNIAAQGTCTTAIGTVLAAAPGPGNSYTCSFTGPFNGPGGASQTDIVTVTAVTSDGTNVTTTDTDDATVTITDVLPTISVVKTAEPLTRPEPGGDFTFTVVVANPGNEPVTITSLTDNIYGDLATRPGSTCGALIGTTLAPGASAPPCSFTAPFFGPPGATQTDVVTATAVDDEGNTATDIDDATVAITNLVPQIIVEKDATPSSLPEPGGDFTFQVRVINNSFEPVTITSLNDNIYGNLATQGSCTTAIGTVLAPAGGTYTCSFTGSFTGNAGSAQVDILTATAVDDQGTTATDSDDAVVRITGVPPTVQVQKTASPGSRPEPGGTFNFTVVVFNPSPEPVTITSLTDDIYGDLATRPGSTCGALIGTTVAPGASPPPCTFVGEFTGVAGASQTDIVTVTVVDDDGQTATDTDDAVVTITAAPSILVEKTAEPSSLPEPGGTFTFTVRVTNTGSEPVTITSLTDDIYGDVATRPGSTCGALIGTTLAPGASSAPCTFTGDFFGNAGHAQIDTVTVEGTSSSGVQVADTDDATVFLTDVPPTVQVDKTADPPSRPEPGGDFTFTVVVTNTSPEPVTITTLTDDVYGDLNGRGTCAVGATLAAGGGTYTCSFTGPFTGPGGASQTDTATVTVVDDDGTTATDTDDATVTIIDVLPTLTVTKTADPLSRPEPGGTFTFTVAVTNTSNETVTLTSLADDIYGDLNGRGTCAVGATLAANGGTYTCSFPGDFFGAAGATQTDTVTATSVDDEGTTSTASDDAVVAITNVVPQIIVEKDATPPSRPEPGGEFTFAVRVTNNSVEPLTITSLTDDVYGDLNGRGTCAVGAVLPAAGGTYTCSFTEPFTGNAGDSQTDTVTVAGVDDEGTTVTDNDDATVTITDVAPVVAVVKDATPASRPEPGGEFTYTVTVTNPSSATEAITITSLTDNIYGNLATRPGSTCGPLVGQTLAPGASANCTFSAPFTGNGGESLTDVVTVAAVDDDGTAVTDNDAATVTLTGVTPTVQVDKTATPASRPEPGGAFTFGVVVTNTSNEPVTITTLTDDVYGNLATRGTCTTAVGTVLAAAPGPGNTYTCNFTATVLGNAGDSQRDTVTVVVTDDDNQAATDTDDALVTISNVLPTVLVDKTASPATLPEEGGSFTFTVVVTNTSFEPVRIASLNDDVHGDLNGRGTCAIGATLAPAPGPANTYACSFGATFTGEAFATQTDTVTVTVVDNDGSTATASDSATVSLTDTPPKVDLELSVDPASRPEPGGTFTFTVVVTNTSNPETVRITSLTSSVHGDLNGRGTCRTGVVIPPAPAPNTFTCTFESVFTGEAGDRFTQTVTVVVADNEGTTATDSDSATVTITDAPPGAVITPPPATPPGAQVPVQAAPPGRIAFTGADSGGLVGLAARLVMLGLLMVAATWRFHGGSLALAGVGAGRAMTLPGRRRAQSPFSGPMAFRGDPAGGSGDPPGSAAPPAPLMGFDHRGIWGPVQTVPTPPSPNQLASGLGLATGDQLPAARAPSTSPSSRAALNMLGMGRNRRR